jgi:flagellar hook-basal body complex protein FliE
MAGSILPISAPSLAAIPAASGSAASSGGAFQEAFSSAIQTVEKFGQNASTSVEQFLSGEGEDVHTTVLAVERATLAFDFFLQARGKVVSAYQEIMRMQI